MGYRVGDMFIQDDLAEDIAEAMRGKADVIVGPDEPDDHALLETDALQQDVEETGGIVRRVGNTDLVLPETPAERREEYRRIVNSLTWTQRKFITNLHLTGGGIEKAAALTGIESAAVRQWKTEWRKAYALSLEDAEMAAKEQLRGALAKAVGVKIELLDSPSEKTRSRAATEIVEWLLGKAVAKSEVSGPGGDPIQIDTRAILLQRLENIESVSIHPKDGSDET